MIRQGTVTLTRFLVTGDLPASLARGFKARGFEPIEVNEDDERAAGWVELEDHDATGFGSGTLLFGDYALARWRVDTLKVPPPVIRAELKAWEKAFKNENGQPPNRAAKRDERLAIVRRLRARAFPATKLTDVAWNLKTGDLYVCSTSDAVLDEIQADLESTFEVTLTLMGPGQVTDQAGVSDLKPTPPLDPSPTQIKALLGREFLTWLVWRSNAGEPLAKVDGEDALALSSGKLRLQGLAGEATAMTVEGAEAPYSAVSRFGLDRGLLVQTARFVLVRKDRTYSVTLDADRLDFRSAKLPAVLSEEEDDELTERLYLVEELARIVDALFAAFLAVRASDVWLAVAWPALRTWLATAATTSAAAP